MSAIQVGMRKTYKTGDQVLAVHEEDGIGFGYRGVIVAPVFKTSMFDEKAYMVNFTAHPAARNGNLAGKTLQVYTSELILASDWKQL